METAVRQPNFADIFEQILVPAIFAPYARDLIDRARPFGPSDRILDLGCGTGIVARVLRERLGGAARIAGVDVAAVMIAKARSLAPEIEWHEGNAIALPFADRSFDVVLAQQVFQFVPDRKVALREARRILAPGGRLLAATWRPRNVHPLHETTLSIAERHLGTPNDKRWSLDGDELRALVLEAGFEDVRLETVTLNEHWADVPIRLSAMAAGFDLAKLTDAEKETKFAAVEAETRAALAAFAVPGGGYDAMSTANVVIARVA